MDKRFFVSFLVLEILIMSVWISAQESAKTDTSKKSEVRKPAGTVQLKTIRPFYYCAVEMTGDYSRHEIAFDSLYTLTSTQDVSLEGPPFGVYWNSPSDTPVEQLKWEIGFQVPDSAKVKEPLKLKQFGFSTLVGAEYQGAFDSPELRKLYGAVFTWIGQNQYRVCGPMIEKFLDIPEQKGNGSWGGQIEIWFPVVKQ